MEVRGARAGGDSEDGEGFWGEEDLVGRNWEVVEMEADVKVVLEEEKGSLGREEVKLAAVGDLKENAGGPED